MVETHEARVVVITGGGGGIGSATAQLFAAEGWRVLVGDRDETRAERTVEAIRSTGGLAESVELDVTSSEQCHAAAERAAHLGPYGALVHCAGVTDTTPFADIDETLWARVLDVNLAGTMRMTRESLGSFDTEASVVTVASVSGRTASTFTSTAYVASKAGVIGLTKSLAAQLAPRGVRVNCVAPGVILTAMTTPYGAERLESLRQKIPVGRLGQPEEVGEAILFLGSSRSRFITGEVIDVNGGQFIA